ncbi:MAG: NIPSNAP family protein, partial [Proteobacteria bacterium]|nr:NIPSNAP family protein [Pseudomonadota bacterium]
MAKAGSGGGGAARDEEGSEIADGERIVSLHAGYETDGVYTNAFLARPVDGKPRPGVVLLSGMGGLTWTQREITRRYARAGFVALSPDYMGGQLPANRTEGLFAKNSLDVTAAVEELAIPIRAKYGIKLAGWYYSDVGELNQVVHIWAYRDYDHLDEAKAQVAQDPDWTGKYVPRVRGLLE